MWTKTVGRGESHTWPLKMKGFGGSYNSSVGHPFSFSSLHEKAYDRNRGLNTPKRELFQIRSLSDK